MSGSVGLYPVRLEFDSKFCGLEDEDFPGALLNEPGGEM